MQRVDTMAARLPQLYRGGELLRGSQGRGGVLDVPAVQLEVVDEIAREVQRTHWFGATYELEHAAKLAALLGFAPEPWQDLDLFRAWVGSLRDAMLRDGGVTVPALEVFATAFAKAFNADSGIDEFAQLDLWNDAASAASAPANSAPALIEFPKAKRIAQLPDPGMPEPLQQFVVTNRGLAGTPLSLLMIGSTQGAEAAPLIANITTGDALVFMGDVPEGKRLWIRGTAKGATARLENEDVTSKLLSVSGLVPGTELTSGQLVSPPKPLTLVRGANHLWFFPIALFDVPGLDRYLFSMPDLTIGEGHFDTSRFDHALFYQRPLMTLYAGWIEETLAAFELRMPAAMLGVRRIPSGTPAENPAPAFRARLEASLTEGVGQLRAAGVAGNVTMETLGEAQLQVDRLRLVMPVELRDRGSVGADRRTSNAGAFEVTSFDDSTFL